MKQFILNKEPDSEGTVRLEDEDYHYLIRVRRLATGECFTAILPNGEEAQIKIINVDNKSLTGKFEPSSPSSSAISASLRLCERSSEITLLQALPKGDKMDLIIRQAAESGITEIVPFVSEFSTGKTAIGEQKFSRWERIIKEARQQSGSKTATVLRKPLQIKELLNYWNEKKENGAVGILFHHVPAKTHQKGLEQNSIHGYLNNNPKVVVYVIGPEGGFSETEVSLFIKNGFKPLTIGDTVLRAETAALYCAAAIKITLLERDAWQLKKA